MLNRTTRRVSSAGAVCARSTTTTTAPSDNVFNTTNIPSNTAQETARGTRPARGEHQPRHDPDPEEAADQHADRHHPPRQIVEPGAAMDPGTLASERPQERRREQERVHVGEGEVGIAERLDRRIPPQDAEQRERIEGCGREEEVRAQQPRPPVAAPCVQEQARGRRRRGRQDRQEGGQLAVLAPEVVPPPQTQGQEGSDPERSKGEQTSHGEADENAAGQAGARRRLARRRLALRPEVGKQVGDDAQVVESPATGRCGLPRAPVPIHVLVQRQRVRHVDDQTVPLLLTHPTCLARPCSDTDSRTARVICLPMEPAFEKRKPNRRVLASPIRHGVAQPSQRPPQRHA